MLPKKHRLPGFMIPQILRKGRWFRGKDFDLIVKRPRSKQAAWQTGRMPQKGVLIASSEKVSQSFDTSGSWRSRSEQGRENNKKPKKGGERPLFAGSEPAAKSRKQTTNIPTQLTVIVPQKLSKKAVRRNRTKRLFVEALHQLLPQIKPGQQIILMARRILEKEKLPDILPEVKRMLAKAKIL